MVDSVQSSVNLHAHNMMSDVQKHDKVNILSWNINNAEVGKYNAIETEIKKWNTQIVLIQEFGDWQGGDKVEQWEACLHRFEWHWNLQDIKDIWEEKIVEEHAESWVHDKVGIFKQIKNNTSIAGRGMAIGIRKDMNARVHKKTIVDRRAFGLVLPVNHKRLEMVGK